MKPLFFLLFFIPSLALSNPYMGSCKSQYEATYKLMMARQQGVPMHKMIDVINQQMPEQYDILTDSELTQFWEAKEEIRKIIERAYTMPNFGFMDSAAHTIAATFSS